MSNERWALSELSDFVCPASWTKVTVQTEMEGLGERSRVTVGDVR